MSVDSWLDSLQRHRAIAVIRTPDVELGLQMARAVRAGGIGIVEITWNSDRPQTLIRQLRQDLPDCLIGAGTLLTAEDVQDAIAAGAQFLFCPHTDPTLIAAAKDASVPIIPGALTPTEIVTAWQAGATCVKVFPIQAVGGVPYLKAIQAPLRDIPLIPTGGVTLENAQGFIKAGAVAVGLSSQLFLGPLVEGQDWEGITQRAKRLLMLMQH